ncbi:MAG: twin-arginine translocase subunit TatC [Elusimicrobia bacterium]|nr:twin-arginine translocase subunit TatC [Elusimicrobiota bacterium]
MIQDEPKPFLDHLDEFRTRLLRSLIVFFLVLGIVLMLPSFENSFSIRAFRWLSTGLLPPGTRLVFLDAFEPAWVILKVGLALTSAILSPYLLYQLFAFLAPAFARESQTTIASVIIAGTALFLLGMCLAYALIIPASLRVLLGLGVAAGGVMQLTFDRFYTFVLTMLLVFGIPFEMPVVLGFLVRLEVLNLTQLRDSRRSVYLGIAIFSAVITPDPTAFSQVLLSIALMGLYETTLLAYAIFDRPKMAEALQAG